MTGHSWPIMMCVATVIIASCRISGSGGLDEPVVSAGNSVHLLSAAQTRCIPRTGKTRDIGYSETCARVDSLEIGRESVRVCIVQYGYCSSKFEFSVQDTSGAVWIEAKDTSERVSRCSCPHRLCYELEGREMLGRRIVHIGIVHPEMNKPCTLAVKQ